MSAIVDVTCQELPVAARTREGKRKRKRAQMEARTVTLEAAVATSSHASQRQRVISKLFIEKCRTEFNADPKNILARNAVVTVGPLLAATDSKRSNQVSHVFLSTLKPEHAKASDQESSGRCWMFAGLNILRNFMIHNLNVENFEFSQTYLFFWDKWEKSNMFLLETIDKADREVEDRYLTMLFENPICDGGYWNMFVNLVNKYGLVPQSAMPETYHSGWSGEINDFLATLLRGVAHKIRRLSREGKSREELLAVKEAATQQVFNVLVKYLGEPPTEFDWSFTDRDYEAHAICGMSPMMFKDMFQGIDLANFVTLVNFPNKPYFKKYSIQNSCNVEGGDGFVALNLPMSELKKYTLKTVKEGVPVWFGADVGKGFHPFKQALDDKLIDYDLLLAPREKLSKAERLRVRDSAATHAMTFVGVNFEDEEGRKPNRWQVENSWGRFGDPKVAGEDGFLSMADDWFDEHVYEVIVPKQELSRVLKRHLKQEPIELKPWDCMGAALKIK